MSFDEQMAEYDAWHLRDHPEHRPDCNLCAFNAGVQAGREAAAVDIEQATQHDEFCGPWCNSQRGACKRIAGIAARLARGAEVVP